VALPSSPYTENTALVSAGALGVEPEPEPADAGGGADVVVTDTLPPPVLVPPPPPELELEPPPDDEPVDGVCCAKGSFVAKRSNVCSWPGSAETGTADTSDADDVAGAAGVVDAVGGAPASVGAASEFGSAGAAFGSVVVDVGAATGGFGFWFSIFIVRGIWIAPIATRRTEPTMRIFFCFASFAFARSCFDLRAMA
jgi:hypothetical protein